MNNYDVIIAGASTTGSWFAKQMAQRGFKVLVLEKQKRENVSRSYDIFHMGKKEMEKFSLPIPKEGDSDYAFEYIGGAAYSSYGNFPKPSSTEVCGMHKHEYIMRLHDEAVKAGAEIIYEAPFYDFLYDESGRIAGAKFGAKGENCAKAKIVADCTGIPSAARRKLKDTCETENFEITERDMFYVLVKYVKYPDGHKKVDCTNSYLQYKAWTAPQADPKGGIVGIGANLSFDYAEEMFREFRKKVPLDKYDIQKVERGATPYRRPPYSFVSDGFIAMGDAACLTKPHNGEGCTSALYQAQIAVDVISDAISQGGYLTAERLWKINKQYIEVQGKTYASMRAILTGAAAIQPDETEYLFSHDVIFSEKVFSGLNNGISFTPAEILKMGYYIIEGLATGVLRKELCTKIIAALKNGLAIMKHYSDFPESKNGFEAWCKKADTLWDKVGSMADTCDEELIERSIKRKEAVSGA
ncbi:MAG: NAD(P)/FAD-dependent oxidoreductase [Acutalibacteraceae bacterium]